MSDFIQYFAYCYRLTWHFDPCSQRLPLIVTLSYHFYLDHSHLTANCHYRHQIVDLSTCPMCPCVP